MRVIADLHIHSRFSRATSKRITVEEISRFAALKGLDLVGTGDFTHPHWMRELRRDLADVPATELFEPAHTSKTAKSTRFMITGEVSTIFLHEGVTKKIHHLILTPNFEIATQVCELLRKYGPLDIDGRPTLELTAPTLVEEVMSVSQDNEVIPAHVWTPWFSLFGAFSGFNRIEDCYQDMTKHIHAIETGLSSDPPMNWRVSALDKFTLVSNSDCHSCWPWRMGREANVFDLERFTFRELVDTLRRKDTDKFKFTIETDPAYGKYHWTGHRNCGVSLPPQEAQKFGGYCPVCRKNLTKGVEQRVEELADRPAGFTPQDAISYMHLLPLSEIISTISGASSPSAQSVWNSYNRLVDKFGSEYAVLVDAPMHEMAELVDSKIAEGIIRAREGKARVIPGYDGVYGQLVLFESENNPKANPVDKVQQRSIAEWCSLA